MPYLLPDPPAGKDAGRVDIPWNEPFKIGRAPENNLVLQNPKVSKKHAQIRFGDGRFWIEDLESKWGTTVNGKKIRTKILGDGDSISFGPEVSYIFHTLPNDPTGAVDVEEDVESETVLDIDIDWEAYEAERQERQQKKGELEEKFFPVLAQVDDTGVVVVKHILDKPVMSIGRSRSNYIVLDHRTASRHHCEIVKKEDEYWINDLDSANGVKVNGKRIKSARLRPGDTIRIGILEFRFQVPQKDEEEPETVLLDEPPKRRRKSLAELQTDGVEETEGLSEKSNIPWGSIIFLGIMFIAVVVLVILSLFYPQ